MKFAIFAISVAVLAVASAEPQRPLQQNWYRFWPPLGSTGPILPSYPPRNPPYAPHRRFRRSPDAADNGLSATWTKPLSGPERRPSDNLDYKYDFVDKNGGSIDATIGLPEQRFDPTVALQGSWQFRGEANIEDINKAADTQTEELVLPQN